MFTSFNCTLAVAHRLRMVIDYDRLIVLDKGQVGVVHLVFGGHNSRLLSCTVDRLRNLIRPGISSIRLMVYSGICVFEAGPSMSWRPQRRQRQGQTIHDRRPDVYYFYIYIFFYLIILDVCWSPTLHSQSDITKIQHCLVSVKLRSRAAYPWFTR